MAGLNAEQQIEARDINEGLGQSIPNKSLALINKKRDSDINAAELEAARVNLAEPMGPEENQDFTEYITAGLQDGSLPYEERMAALESPELNDDLKNVLHQSLMNPEVPQENTQGLGQSLGGQATLPGSSPTGQGLGGSLR